jgi:hypothetical protein
VINNIGDGQVWIATHSINLLAHFDLSDIWYVQEGTVQYAGSIPDEVLKGLLGNDDEREKLASFLQRPAEIAYNLFCSQCLQPPGVVITGLGDRQVDQAKKILESGPRLEHKQKILDFGIGQARVLSTIDALMRQQNKVFSDFYDYYGYDIDSKYSGRCREVFESIYSGGIERYYNSPDDLLVAHDENSFDYIMLSNVFHEIHPRYWKSIFTGSNNLFHLLKPDGNLLIIEDQILPIGEQAHLEGFLVFDSLHFKKLFKIVESDGYRFEIHSDNPRLKAHFFPKQCLSRIDTDSMKSSIESLRESSLEKVKEIRLSGTKSFQNGRQLAFWSQQMTNATLVLSEL